MRQSEVSPTQLLARLLDSRVPFRLYFCVREVRHTAFAVGHDQPDPWHLLYLPEAGAIQGRIENAEVTVEAGQILWVQPNARFAVHGPVKAKHLTISVCRFHLRDTTPFRLSEDFRIGAVGPREPVFDELLPGHSIEPEAEPLRLRAVLARILCRGFFSAVSPPAARRDAGLLPPVRQAVVTFIQQHIADRFPVADVARHVRLNPDYFARQFKRSFGVPPQTWIKQIRIREAADHLLASNATVSEIATRFGYENVYFFSRQFRQVMGMSPSAWRARGN